MKIEKRQIVRYNVGGSGVGLVIRLGTSIAPNLIITAIRQMRTEVNMLQVQLGTSTEVALPTSISTSNGLVVNFRPSTREGVDLTYGMLAYAMIGLRKVLLDREHYCQVTFSIYSRGDRVGSGFLGYS
ncbi:hypothetical protein MMC07_001420 [Pseudocyphellaria aurata]|nr:hypothetical protein [Pseudocyphellaria aurata]